MIHEYIIKVDEDKKDIMGNCPLVDKPKELVRCKDCKWWENYECQNDNLARQMEDCGCYPRFMPYGDWFCAEGERR